MGVVPGVTAAAVGADAEIWVYDSSVNLKGNAPLRSSTGVWRALFFIMALEFSERLSYFGLVSNLIIYLTSVLNEDIKTAAKEVNYWLGVTTTIPLICGFLADAYLGRFKTVVVSCLLYLMGLTLLTLCRLVPSLKPCETGESCVQPRRDHKVAFFIAMYLISAATAAHKPSLQSFGADQFDENHDRERQQKMSFFNWWNSGLCSGLLLGVTVLVYIQDNVSWTAADIILISVMGVSFVIFILGMPLYRYSIPKGSPLTPLAKVVVAAFAKRNLPYPANPAQLYEMPESERGDTRFLYHTNSLRFLDKAAIIESGKDFEKQSKGSANPWRLATVTRVEETKLLIKMIPVWLTTIMFGVCNAQGLSFFINQASIMQRKLTRSFTVPAASMYAFTAVAMIATLLVYDKIIVPKLRRMKNNERGISILQRIGIGLSSSVMVLVIAAMVERRRLDSIHRGEPIMSVFWLLPQFLFLGVGDGFALVGLQEYFYDQAPDEMRSLGIAFFLSVVGVSSFISSLLITIVDHVSGKVARSWFSRDLNDSRLDNFYWVLALLCGINMCVYVVVARRQSSKNVQKIALDGPSKVPGGLHLAETREG